MDLNKYDKDFQKKYHDDAEETNYLYEYKSGEFQAGEIVGMQTTPYACKGTVYVHDKSTDEPWTKFTQLGEFISEEYYRESDLQYPICDNC
ncbi:MAG: hypothetical protein J6X03_05345 [Bacilli bacterium]|nr:hypothetical protein [Bacilli bacterium]